MAQAEDYVIATSLGKLGLTVQHEKLYAIRYLSSRTPVSRHLSRLAKDVKQQINAYLKDPTWQFDIPYVLEGTAFQKKIWQALTTLSSGETCFYGDLARTLQTGPRAVGGACRNNPIPIIIPCHRVLSKSGIGGYDGDWGGGKVSIKRQLLQHEGVSGA